MIKKWHGVDRSKYKWYPIIDYEVCNGCGMCLLTCGNNVFKWDLNRNIPVIANPDNCVLGCTTCAKLCPKDAITFQDDPRKFLRKIILENKIFPQVKKELDERLEKYPNHVVTIEEVSNARN